MKIAIAGAGEIGENFCETFCKEGHQVTLIDKDYKVLNDKEDVYEAKFEVGDISDIKFLSKINIAQFDYYIATTDIFSTNIYSASIAKALGSSAVVSRVDDNKTGSNKHFNTQKHFNIDLLFDPNASCASEIAKTIRDPERVVIENFARNKIEVHKFIVKPNSRLINKKLANLRIGNELRFINILHDEKNEIPNGNSIIYPNDTITVAGYPEAIEDIKNQLSNVHKDKNKVSIVIFGQKNIIINLIKFLNLKKYCVTIIDKDFASCEALSQEFQHLSIINGDCASITFLKEEQICECDYFIACSINDEQNIMCVTQAKYLGAKNTITLLNSKNYEPLLDSMQMNLGIDYIISKRKAAIDEIKPFVSDKPFYELTYIKDREILFFEFKIEKNCKIINKPIKNIGIPSNCILISLIHDFVAKIPSGNDVLNVGDRLICSTTPNASKALINLLTK